jgi:hypothetical protein
MSPLERWWLIVGPDGHAFEVRDAQPDPILGHGQPFKDRVVEVAPADQLAGAVSTIETHLHEPPRAPKGVRQADFRRGWEAARQAALIALGGAEREYPE